jgi:NitT/TauT family transport system substrate-binding protein
MSINKSFLKKLKPIFVALTFVFCSSAIAQQSNPTKVENRIVLLVDEIKAIRSFPAILAEKLGYLNDDGINVIIMNIRDDVFHDKLLQDGRIDAVMAYYHHNIVNQSKGIFTKSIATLGVTPGMKFLSSNNNLKKVESPKDLKGTTILTGGNNSSKTTVTNELILNAGLTLSDYKRIPTYGKEKNLELLNSGEANLVAAPNPDDLFYIKKGNLQVFADLTTLEETKKFLGAPYPSNSIFMLNERIQSNPKIAQHLANAFVKTLKYINSHSPEEIAKLIPDEVKGKDSAAYLEALKQQIPMYKNNGLMPEIGAQKEFEALYALNSKLKNVDIQQTFTNEFVNNSLMTNK